MSTDDFDRDLIGRVIKGEIERRYHTLTAYTREHPEPARRTIERAQSGDDRIDFRTLAKIEGDLGLPRGAFSAIGRHDWKEMRAMGIDADLIRWVRGGATATLRVTGTGEA